MIAIKLTNIIFTSSVLHFLLFICEIGKCFNRNYIWRSLWGSIQDSRFKTLFPISNKHTLYIKRIKKTIQDKDDIEEMAKGQKGLEWASPIYKPRLHIYSTNLTSTNQIKGLHNKHAPKLPNISNIFGY